jgi:hypothetical protein
MGEMYWVGYNKCGEEAAGGSGIWRNGEVVEARKLLAQYRRRFLGP